MGEKVPPKRRLKLIPGIVVGRIAVRPSDQDDPEDADPTDTAYVSKDERGSRSDEGEGTYKNPIEKTIMTASF